MHFSLHHFKIKAVRPIALLSTITGLFISSCSILPEPPVPSAPRDQSSTANDVGGEATTNDYMLPGVTIIGTTPDFGPAPISIPGGGSDGGYSGPADAPVTGGGGDTGGGGSAPESVAGDTPQLRAFEADYRTRMSESEKAIFDRMTRGQQVKYLSNAQSATSAAERKYPGSGLHNGPGDAYRHALFSAYNARNFGVELAKQLGDAHENQPQDPLEKAMDLFNNQQGRDISQQTNFTEAAVVHLLETGWLLIIENGKLVPSHP